MSDTLRHRRTRRGKEHDSDRLGKSLALLGPPFSRRDDGLDDVGRKRTWRRVVTDLVGNDNPNSAVVLINGDIVLWGDVDLPPDLTADYRSAHPRRACRTFDVPPSHDGVRPKTQRCRNWFFSH